jgi:hypothetical protein
MLIIAKTLTGYNINCLNGDIETRRDEHYDREGYWMNELADDKNITQNILGS